MALTFKTERYFYRMLLALGLVLVLSVAEYFLIQAFTLRIVQIPLLLSFTAVKLFVIVRLALRSIFYHVINGVEYTVYLVYIFLAIILFILSFCSDFVCIYLFDKNSFEGFDANISTNKMIFEMFFLSTAFFTFLGAINVSPAGTLAEFYLLLESLVTYIGFIFFLSNFSNVRNTLLLLRKDKIIDSLIKKYS